jgi:hypothetical protein
MSAIVPSFAVAEGGMLKAAAISHEPASLAEFAYLIGIRTARFAYRGPSLDRLQLLGTGELERADASPPYNLHLVRQTARRAKRDALAPDADPVFFARSSGRGFSRGDASVKFIGRNRRLRPSFGMSGACRSGQRSPSLHTLPVRTL